MKSWYRRSVRVILPCVVGIAVVLMGRVYFQYISHHIYKDSSNHLVEIYSQANHNFASFLERNWGNLDDWVHHLQIEDEDGVLTFLEARQEYWKFSEFYFLDQDGRCITPHGDKEQFALENAKDALFQQKENIMSNETLPSGQAVTLFAIPVPKGTYLGFDYSAIAISYTNADMVASLDVDAFAGKSMCFVIYTDGRVLLSTQESGSAFGNYLTYLNAGSDMDKEMLAQMRQDWEDGVSGVVRCRIGGVKHYISYQSVGYEDCVLLGIVPENAASASLLEIQRATIDVLVKVFLLIGILVVVWVVHGYRQKTKKSVLELRYRELMFDMLSKNVDDIFLMLDSQTWKVDYLSPNVERLLGIPLDEAAKDVSLLGDSVVGEHSVTFREDFADIPIQSSRCWEREHIHRGTGERHWYRETVYHESVEGVEKYVIVMSDRTQERQMSQNLEKALAVAKSANEAKSHFLSNMSHDIRTPMNAIVGFAVLLEKDADDGEKVREYTRKISASSQHLLSLINDVLDMSKIESGKTSLNVAVFSLPELVDELYSILLPQAKAKNQTFEFHTEGHPVELLLGDKLRLNQILINLLSNAIKYTQDGGTIDFTVQTLPGSSPQYAKLRFVVADNGMGMSEEFLKTIYESFSREVNSTTSGIQGTGLGMAITKSLVELMGGVIQVTSRQGEGSVFTVEMSFAIPEQTEREIEPSVDTDERVLDGMLFLVAEDNEMNAEILSAMLSMEGAECERAVNGKEVVEMFLHSEPDYYDMVLMDVQMPVMNGYEATRQIRACEHPRAKDIPIVAMTADAFAEDVRHALDSGMNGHLSKPLDMKAAKALLGRLRKSQEENHTEYTEKGDLDK